MGDNAYLMGNLVRCPDCGWEGEVLDMAVDGDKRYCPDCDELLIDDSEELEPESVACPECGGDGVLLGNLGRREHFRCRDCGIDFSRAREASKTADYTSQDGMMDGGWGSTVTQNNWAWDQDPSEFKMCESCGQEFDVEPFAYSGWDRICRVCSTTTAKAALGMVEVAGDFEDWVQDHAPTSRTAGRVLASAMEEENPGWGVREIWIAEDGRGIVAYLRPTRRA